MYKRQLPRFLIFISSARLAQCSNLGELIPVSFVKRALPDLEEAICKKVVVVLTLALLSFVASVCVIPFIESIEFMF
mgnify:CR=1 FL=1